MAGAPDPGPAFAEAVVSTFEFVVARLTARLEGMDDDEYFWEPAAQTWTVREVEPGSWAMDGPTEGDDAERVTSIAWRMAHLAGHVLGGFATWLRDGGAPYGADAAVPGSAAAGTALLEANWRRFDEGLAALDAERWARPIGEQFGPHAEASTAALVLHVLDELVHHAAEIALLRDLYRTR